jgi:glutamate racemase
MKIGIFDSGLGGLLVAHSLMVALPEYDYVYLGDTARVPYGNRSLELIYQFTCEALRYLFEQQDCALVILACNTASADALRRVQQEWLPEHFENRKVLGVVVPTAEAVQSAGAKRVGVLATTGTVRSAAYITEIIKLVPGAIVTQSAAPLLVPLIENDGLQYARPMLRDYLQPLIDAHIDTLVLGCTHYPALLGPIGDIMGPTVYIVATNVILPAKLADYLHRHTEIESHLTHDGERTFLVTDITPGVQKLGETLFTDSITFKAVTIG